MYTTSMLPVILQGSLEAQFKLNPVRLSMDGASFPVAAKDMANLRGRDIRSSVYPEPGYSGGTGIRQDQS